jgi:Rieske 2Fe-2S family protein
VTTRVLPAGPRETRADVTWLVDAAAEEGRDYDLGRLLPFWQLTSEQDWELCERNQRGVQSSGYRPGPYSPTREANVIAFVDWYRRATARATAFPAD